MDAFDFSAGANGLEYFGDIEFTLGNLIVLFLTGVLLAVIPLAFLVYWKVKQKEKAKWRYLFAGAAGFIVSARVLELAVHYFCIISDNPVSRFITGSNIAYIVYGTVMAGVFEECGRYVVMRYILKKDRTAENAVMYGIGHGGIEVLGVVLPSILSLFAISAMFYFWDLGTALTALGINEDNAALAYEQVSSAAGFGWGMMAANVFERIAAMLLHISLSVIVYLSVAYGRPRYLLWAVLGHMAMDLFPAMYQRGIVPILVCEVWVCLCAAAAVFLAARMVSVCRKESADTAVDDSGTLTEDSNNE